MDPVAAFSLAASIVQFVSFAWGVTKGTAKIRKDGMTDNVRALSDVTKSLQQWVADLKSGPREHIPPHLCDLLDGCGDLAEKMRRRLEESRVKKHKLGSVTHSLATLLNTAWNKSEREDLQNRLNHYRLEICTHVILIFLSVSLFV
jgi:hypothetical protein